MSRSLSSFIVVSLFAVSAQAADWNQWRGPDRNGVAPSGPALIDALPKLGLKPLWLSEDDIPAANGGGWSSPIVAQGRVYLFTHKKTKSIQGQLPPKKFPWLAPDKRVGMSDEEYQQYEVNRRDEDEQRSRSYRYDEILYCLDAQTGKLVWKNQRLSVYTRFAQSGSPAIIDGRAYLLGAGRMARCIDSRSGEDIWQVKLPGEFRDEFRQSSFVVTEGVAVVLADRLFGLDTKSGKILWQGSEEDESGLHTSPTVWRHDGKSHIIVTVAGSQTVCVEARSGRELWRVKSQAGNSTPVVVGDRLITYGGSRKNGLRCFALSLNSAEHLWTYQGLADPGSSPVVIDGYVYVQGAKRLACVDLKTGKAAWTASLDMANPRYSSLAAADDKVFYSFDALVCFAADANDYQLLINGRIDQKGLWAEESDFREMLNMDKLELTAAGQKEAERIWRKRIGSHGPQPCTTPAIADGRLYVRLKNGIACYDLRALDNAE